MTAWKAKLPGFTLFAALLAVLVFGWLRVFLLLLALFYHTAALPSLAELLAYFGVGFLFVATVFALSRVVIPMLLDKDVDTVTAVVHSLQAVYKNLLTMTVWAAMIVILTAVGFATYFIGLIIIKPVLGLANWHAYRAMITYES